MIILCHLRETKKRTHELKKLMPNIPQRLLTQQLRELEADGIIIRKTYARSLQRWNTLYLRGIGVSIKRVQRLMRRLGIASITYKKFRPFRKGTSPTKERENLLQRDFTTTALNQKWVSDITYIPTRRDGWCYLASVMDLHSKKIIGYSFSRTMTTALVMRAVQHALHDQSKSPGLILHSDLGSQYTSEELASFLERQQIKQSFSRKGCPYDNACIESFHAILKKEEVHHRRYQTFEEARVALFQFIEGWYNRQRVHSQLNYQTPQAFEEQFFKKLPFRLNFLLSHLLTQVQMTILQNILQHKNKT
ncbi:transcriptional regulator, HxlR family [Marininema mesophilum]|uniref:Transcriptional regulator, HxlR family n=1 Tax=Marininema mesophilum TaxID=1048340 RepID=A0A1H2UNR8_9BACL|nr:transcriptional regulator, HxlR family [Marininema mesophilum]